MIQDYELSPAETAWLQRRTYLDKVAIGLDYPPGDEREALYRLERAGLLRLMDRAVFLPHLGVTVDVYQLTPKGVEFCRKHEIVALDP